MYLRLRTARNSEPSTVYEGRKSIVGSRAQICDQNEVLSCHTQSAELFRAQEGLELHAKATT